MLRTSSALGAIRNYNHYLTAASVPHQCVSFRELTKPQLDHRRGSIQLRALTRPDTAVRPHWPHDLTSKTAYHQRGLKLARFQLPYPPDRIVREVGAARHQSPRSTFEHITALTAELFVCWYDHSTYCLQDDCVSHLKTSGYYLCTGRLNINKDSQCTYIITMRQVHLTTVAVEKR